MAGEDYVNLFFTIQTIITMGGCRCRAQGQSLSRSKFFYQGYYVGWMDLRSELNPTRGPI